MVTKRSVALAVSLTMLLWGCGGDELSLAEYVQSINALEQRASRQAEALAAQGQQIADFTPQDLQAILERAHEIQIEVKEAADPIDPPREISDLHYLIFDWHTRFITVEEALAARAGDAEDTEADWEELSNSSEMVAYRAAISEGKEVCNEFQAKLDAMVELGVFADVPWMPSEFGKVGKAVLGCAWFPEQPADVYRYPPAV